MVNYQPRPSQRTVLDWVAELPDNIKYILCEIPVGGGKSPLALNLSGWFSSSKGNAYILTPQKVLQKQYEEDPEFEKNMIHSLYGKSNYKCESKKTDCEMGSEIKPRCTECPHNQAFRAIPHSPNVVLNYTLAFLLFKYAMDEKIIQKRKLIVFDEAHTIENHLTEFNSISISEFRCNQIGSLAFRQFTSMTDAVEWMKNVYHPALLKKISKLSPEVSEIVEECEFESRAPTKDELRTIALTKELVNHQEMIVEQILRQPIERVQEDYVLVNEGKTVFKFKELYGKRNFRQFVDPMAEKFLFMSGTILNKEAFCSDLGIDPEQTAFLSLPSEFGEDNRPIFYMPTTKMTYGWDKPDNAKNRQMMIDRIVKLCSEIHPEETGIIHAGSFQIAQFLVENLSKKIPHKIMHHNPGSGNKRDAVLEEFQEPSDGVPRLLISPSITEGLDLKDDKGRFAIFAKVPYPAMSDAWIKRRMSISNEWYNRQALIAIMQGAGRVVRSESDWGHVYILDSSFGNLMRNNKYMLPKWWIDSVQTI